MRLSDLQSKNIVNVLDGKNVGSIIDVNVNEAGAIESLVIENNKRLLSGDIQYTCFLDRHAASDDFWCMAENSSYWTERSDWGRSQWGDISGSCASCHSSGTDVINHGNF